MPRLLALDLDGTLLDPEAMVTPRVAAALHRAAASGLVDLLLDGAAIGLTPQTD